MLPSSPSPLSLSLWPQQRLLRSDPTPLPTDTHRGSDPSPPVHSDGSPGLPRRLTKAEVLGVPVSLDQVLLPLPAAGEPLGTALHQALELQGRAGHSEGLSAGTGGGGGGALSLSPPPPLTACCRRAVARKRAPP